MFGGLNHRGGSRNASPTVGAALYRRLSKQLDVPTPRGETASTALFLFRVVHRTIRNWSKPGYEILIGAGTSPGKRGVGRQMSEKHQQPAAPSGRPALV